ncbi:MAG: HlyD family efflux transporter periplasmic adaptor subunit [Pirellulaceae bacterium]
MRRYPVRSGNTVMLALAALAVVAVAGLLGWWFLGRGSGKDAPRVLVNRVSRGPYDYVVIEQGEVESASNIELKCEVRSRGGGSGSSGGGVTIIEVIPEGTQVQAGDVLVKLDSSALEQERVTQSIKVNGQRSLVVQAENTFDAAEIALIEYLEGTFKQEEKLILSEMFVGEQALRSTQLALNSAQRLAAKNLVTGLQLEGEQLAVDNARNTLDIAQSKLHVLRTYTKLKNQKVFESAIATAEAQVANENSSLKLEEDKLAEIDEQIGKCTIRAPSPGQVVYANEFDSWRGDSEFVVTAGAAVRERQTIIRLPNSAEMQIKATVNEARITLVRPGLPVSIRVDALKDQMIQGEVIKVNQYAEPGGYSSGNIKKYATFVRILNPPPGLRSGMNAEVRIHVERKSDALQIPVQAVAEHKGHYFTVVQKGETYETREVQVGSSNDKVMTIEGGLTENELVVMNPRGFGKLLDLPDLEDATPVQVAEIERSTPGEAMAIRASLAAAQAPQGLGSGSPGEAGGSRGERGKGKGRGNGNMTPTMLVARYLESDADKDGKLSKDEIASLDDRRKQGVADADTNKDTFLDRAELTVAAGAQMQRMREQRVGQAGAPGGGSAQAAGGGE